jgi:hypothetical protein
LLIRRWAKGYERLRYVHRTSKGASGKSYLPADNVAHDGSVSIICRVTTGALPMSELGQQRRASASALTKLRQVLSQSCRAINAFGSQRATLIGLSNQETDHERQRSDQIEQSTAP